MLPHLPEAIFWDVLKRTDDIKTCVAIWSSENVIYKRYSKQEFWKNICYHHFQVSSNPYNISWCDIYWWLFRNIKGCGYCNRIMAPPKDGFKSSNVIYTDDNCVHLDSLTIYVCKRCKDLLGDTVIHRSHLDGWKLSLLQRLRGNHHSSLFDNYYGTKQIDKCFGYNLKCTECLKNVRNVRCTNNKCGSCCKCKYHKSHYETATPGDIIISFDIYTLIHTTVSFNDNFSQRKKRCIKKSLYVQNYSLR